MKIVRLFLMFSSICMFLGPCARCELILTSFVVGIGSAIVYTYSQHKCRFIECCTDEYINPDLVKLEYLLTTKLYGQEIAHEMVIHALRGHLGPYGSSKALVMSFHGTPGTGKNYVVQMIVSTLYKYGAQSQYFHFFNGRNDFPLQQKTDEYKEELYKIVSNSLNKCERSMFVFDEVDKMPEGILNVLVPFLDYNSYYKSSKNNAIVFKNKAIFIFLSNTGSLQIVHRLTTLWERGKRREDVQLQDFERIIEDGAFREKGGFHHSDAIQTSLIDHYVPFLPLEEEHVKKCLKYGFIERGIAPTEEMIEEVLSHLTFGPEPHKLYSMAGCKRIDQKVAAIVERMQSKPESKKVK